MYHNGKPRCNIHDSILDFVGNTPLIRLNRIPKDHGITCDIYAKCEFLNPSGSIKDRIALSMLRDAQKSGVVHEDSTLIEPTSGNTGIGIAFNAALLNTKCIIVTEVKNSDEKVNTLRLMGAEVIQVKVDEDEIAIAHKLRDGDKHMVMLNQFDNLVNPRTHYETTGQEIISALCCDVDMVVMGAGTGGTITGIGRKFKDNCPNCKVVVAEPHGSTLFNGNGKNHPFLVEGIGGSWAPTVMDKTVVDHMEVVTDEESFLMAREMAKKEGLLCGGSSGTAMAAAIKAIKRLNIGCGKRVVVILPDGIRNYMTKFVSDQWMEAHLFMDPPPHNLTWWDQPITKVALKHVYPIIQSDYTCEQALNVMKDNIAVVVDKNGRFVGAISKDTFRKSATNPTKLPGQDCEVFNFKDKVTDHLFMHVCTLAKNGRKGMPTIGRLSRILDITPFVVIGYEVKDVDKDYFVPEGVVTGDDVLDYIYANSH